MRKAQPLASKPIISFIKYQPNSVNDPTSELVDSFSQLAHPPLFFRLYINLAH